MKLRSTPSAAAATATLPPPLTQYQLAMTAEVASVLRAIALGVTPHSPLRSASALERVEVDLAATQARLTTHRPLASASEAQSLLPPPTAVSLGAAAVTA